jgi:hypothetical protein
MEAHMTDKNNNTSEFVFRGLMTANMIMHTISGCFAGIWIANMVAPDGVLSPVDWLKTGLAVVAIAVGLTYGTYVALRHLPPLPIEQRRGAIFAFVVSYAAFAIVLALASASVLGAPSGERAHIEHSFNGMKEAVAVRRRAAASINNRVSALTDCVETATAMSTQESATGAFSREGGDVGRVAVTLSNIANSCETARDAIYINRASLVRYFDRADRLLIDLRRVIDNEQPRHQKLVAVRKIADELQRTIRAINDGLAVEALQSAASSTLKDWNAAGLPIRAANAIAQNFNGVADRLTEGLDDVAAIKDAIVIGIPMVSNVSYLFLYPDATMGALAIGLVIELIPLGGILLGLTVLQNKLPPSPQPQMRMAEDAIRKPRVKRALRVVE